MKAAVTVVSIGFGDASLLTLETAGLLKNAPCLILRTARHGIVPWLEQEGISYCSMDDLYDRFEQFDGLYREIARTVWKMAEEKHSVVYAVPDPLSDRSVEYLFQEKPFPDAAVSLKPGVSYADAYLSCSRGMRPGSIVKTVPAASLPEMAYDPEETLLICEIDSAMIAGEVKIYLSEYLEDEQTILFYPHSAKVAEPVQIQLMELDRQKTYDHCSAALIPGIPFGLRRRFTVGDLLRIMNRLRAPDGCPWDREQTHETLRPYLVEEAWEAVDAINENDMDQLADELGDVLLQVVFHASIGKDYDEFTLTDIVSKICRKMIHRHPHVFGSSSLRTAEEVSGVWEKIKREETGAETVGESLSSVSKGLPSLKYAAKVNRKAFQVPWMNRSADQILEEAMQALEQLRNAGQELSGKRKRGILLGYILFLLTEWSAVSQTDCELVLREVADEYIQTFQRMENRTGSDGGETETERRAREFRREWLSSLKEKEE